MPTARKHQMRLFSALASAMVDLYVTPGDRKPPTEFRIFRKGINKSDKGDFLFDDEAAASVMEAFRQKGVDVSIDYDHQALRAGDIKAPAAGWCQLEVRDGELWATGVRWTPQAAGHLEAGEYRYFSPLFHFDDRTGRILHVINSALTNTPALWGIDALVAASARTPEEDMDPELKKAQERIAELERQVAALRTELETARGQTATAALSTSMGLAANSGADEIRKGVAGLVAFRKEVLVIAGKDSDAAAIGALSAMRDQATEVAVLREKAEAAEAAALGAEFGAHLDALSTKGTDGRFLPPAAREKAEAMARDFGGGKFTKAGIEKAKSYLSAMCVAGEPTAVKEPNAATALSAMEIEIAQRTGTSLEAKRKYKELQAAANRSVR